MTLGLADLFQQYTDHSGPGSTLEYSAPYREFLVSYLVEHDVRSILDLGCGDLVIMNAVIKRDPEISYVGVDCLLERVVKNRALYPDLSCFCDDVRLPDRERFRWFDLVICKDVIQHWDTPTIHAWLRAITAFGVPALVTNCARGEQINWDIGMGDFRPVDLTKHPFSRGEVVFSWDTKDVVLLDYRR
jgi:hypothetical protein